MIEICDCKLCRASIGVGRYAATRLKRYCNSHGCSFPARILVNPLAIKGKLVMDILPRCPFSNVRWLEPRIAHDIEKRLKA
jgi:hypothetical protein